MADDTATPDFRKDLIRYGGDAYPEIVEKALGCYVYDAAGNKILDFTSGQMCATVGHNHPNVVAAIKKSCDTALHLFSGMIPRSVVDLAAKLAALVPKPLAKSLFLNTGSESNDAALKMAKLATGGYEVVGLGGSWHGVTGNASAVSFASDRKGYGPGMPGSFVIPEPNAYRCPVKHCRDKCDLTCMKVGFQLFDMQSTGAPAAVIAEPVISAGGVIVPPPGYFDALKVEAQKRGMLLVFDEAQTAFGRLGHWFAASQLGVTPDIMTVSKTLGGGMPLAGVITSSAIEETCHARGFAFYTSHVSDPLPANVGLAVLETIERERLLERSRELGDYLAACLAELKDRHAEIGDLRGMGLLRGIELVKDRETREPHHALGAATTTRCLELGLSMNIRRRPERGSVWRIAPPLTVTRADIDLAMTIFDQALRESKDALSRERVPARLAPRARATGS
ncbi:MAG TPA: aspartate aminotransferase family protein [Casimicrobiaceae bacterium]|jgi:2,2-dialkylglycine decarboxylase (pyruvate)|nr:aspartate aminotransferase family protein [Casimicrobiaceae bacterium]